MAIDDWLEAQGKAYVAKLRAKPRQPAEVTAPTKRRGPPPEEVVSLAIRKAIRACVPGAFFWHTPNETGGSRNTRHHLFARKAQGVVSGIPDITVTWPNHGIAFIEVKAPGRSATDQQQHIHSVLAGNGHHVATCDSVDAALEFLRAAGAPVHGSTRLHMAVPVSPL